MDANNPEVMFYCSLCGCAANEHDVDASWQAEEEQRRAAREAASAAATAQRRASAAAAGGATAAAMQQEADAFAELGLPLGADAKSVARAYKRLALRLHPDKQQQAAANGAAPSQEQAAAAKERFVKVAAAYALLSERPGGRR
jgi:hypothetical protein